MRSPSVAEDDGNMEELSVNRTCHITAAAAYFPGCIYIRGTDTSLFPPFPN